MVGSRVLEVLPCLCPLDRPGRAHWTPFLKVVPSRLSKQFVETVLLSEEEFEAVRGKGLPTVYHDPVLKNNPAKYTAFLREFVSCNIIDFTYQPVCVV